MGAARPWLPAGICCWWPETAPKCCSVLMISVDPHPQCYNSPWFTWAFPTSACAASELLGAPWSTGSVQGGDVSSANEIPNPKLLCYSKPVKIQTASLCVCDSCRHSETSVAQQISPSLPQKQGAFCTFQLVPWDTFLYPFEVERVSLVNRQADDFRNFEGMDGSKVETDAEEQCH